MGALVKGVGTLLGGGNENADFQAVQGATQPQAQTAYNQTQQGIQAQQALLHALASQNGIQNQSNVFNQIQGIANGTGPNPAEAMLNQQTGQNVANQAALMAGQRGASANAGLIARQAAQQGGALQQQAVGQGATMQAQQQLNALGQLGGLANQQVAQQQAATGGLNQFAQGQQQNVLGGINAQNSANAGMAQANANNSAKGIGGLANGLGGAALTLLAEGGEVENPKVAEVPQVERFRGSLSPHVEHIAKIYHAEKFAKGGKVNAMVSPGEVYLSPVKAEKVAKDGKNPIKEGEKIPGKPKVSGNSYENDTVPKKLESGGVVIPNSIMQSADPVGAASEFVKRLMEKSKEHGDFKEALKKAIASRKAS